MTFDVEIDATRLTEDEVAFLVAVLDQGAKHASQPHQFGANGADGWGRMDWSLTSVRKPTSFTGVGFDCCTDDVVMTAALKPTHTPPHVAVGLTLAFHGPFLVNDASRAKESDVDDGRTNFTPLKRANGDIWLPASSFRGALRNRAEFLLRSLDPKATGDPNAPAGDGPVERLFGETSKASRLTITEFVQDSGGTLRHQDFVAIDRFTGGAAYLAKFDAKYADKPVLASRLTLDLEGLKPEDVALLAAALRDVCGGEVAFGFGGGKGYGTAEGTIRFLSCTGVEPAWSIPESLQRGALAADGIEWLRRSLPAVVHEKRPLKMTRIGKLTVKPGQIKGLFSYRVSYDVDGTEIVIRKLLPHLVAEELRNVLVDDREVQLIFSDDGQLASVRKLLELNAAADEAVLENPAFPATGSFANPYYFLPLVDRSKFKECAPLADAAPKCHSQYHADTYSGTIRVKLTTEIPLLICERLTDSEARQDHKTYSMRVDDKGQPMLASSSVRGMLRSAYEAITNSRFGVFPIDVHSKKLEFRPLGSGQSRRPYQRSPLDLLPIRLRLRPAILCSELSPADRVFGWVNPVPKSKSDTSKDPRAYKSALRIGPVECTKSVIVNEPITLAILAQPKPAQGRFYLGKKQGDGTVTVQQPHEWPRQTKEQAGYHDGNRIRGPKVYPYHRDFVLNTGEDTKKDNQNRTVKSHIGKGAEFEFTLHVTNLSAFELGALIWLLSLEKDHFLRLGLGKPLGFGSVRAEIVSEGTCIATGKEWTACIGTTGLPASVEREPLRIAFEKTMLSENPQLLKAFDIAAKGFENLPIQYPNINGEIEHFKWFVENERTRKLSLPDLTSDPSLPKNPSRQ